MRILETSFGLLLCATLTGCPGPDLRPELQLKETQIATLNAQLRTAQEQTRSTQMQLDATRVSLAQITERRRYDQGLMKGLASQLRRVLKLIDSGFHSLPGDLAGPADVPEVAQPDPVPPSPPLSSTP